MTLYCAVSVYLKSIQDGKNVGKRNGMVIDSKQSYDPCATKYRE